jgi:hypothetical protein
VNNLLKTYQISTTASDSVNALRLHSEINSSGSVTNFACVCVSGDNLQVWGEAIANESALDAVVASHDSYSLSEHKAQRYAQIDGRTSALIAQGFSFDGKQFSLSIIAQNNWNTIHSNKSVLSFPFNVTTLDNDTYALALSDVDAFWGTAVNTVKTHWDSGRVLKKQIFDATTKQTVDSVIDNR